MRMNIFLLLLLCMIMLFPACVMPHAEPTIVKTYYAVDKSELYERENTPEGAVLVTYHEMSDGTWIAEGGQSDEKIKYLHRVELSGVPVNAAPGAGKWRFTILCMDDEYTFDEVFAFYASMKPRQSAEFKVVELSFNAR